MWEKETDRQTGGRADGRTLRRTDRQRGNRERVLVYCMIQYFLTLSLKKASIKFLTNQPSPILHNSMSSGNNSLKKKRTTTRASSFRFLPTASRSKFQLISSGHLAFRALQSMGVISSRQAFDRSADLWYISLIISVSRYHFHKFVILCIRQSKNGSVSPLQLFNIQQRQGINYWRRLQ